MKYRIIKIDDKYYPQKIKEKRWFRKNPQWENIGEIGWHALENAIFRFPTNMRPIFRELAIQEIILPTKKYYE